MTKIMFYKEIHPVVFMGRKDKEIVLTDVGWYGVIVTACRCVQTTKPVLTITKWMAIMSNDVRTVQNSSTSGEG